MEGLGPFPDISLITKGTTMRNEYIRFDCAGGRLPARTNKTFNAIPALKIIAILVAALTATAII